MCFVFILTPQVRGWVEFFVYAPVNFSFQIVYIAGKSNVVSWQGWSPAEDGTDVSLQEGGDVVESTTFP